MLVKHNGRLHHRYVKHITVRYTHPGHKPGLHFTAVGKCLCLRCGWSAALRSARCHGCHFLSRVWRLPVSAYLPATVAPAYHWRDHRSGGNLQVSRHMRRRYDVVLGIRSIGLLDWRHRVTLCVELMTSCGRRSSVVTSSATVTLYLNMMTSVMHVGYE